MPAHEHPGFGASIVLGGALEETARGHARQAGAAEVVVKPAATRHANRFGSGGARLLSFQLHPTLGNPWLTDVRGVSRWCWFAAAPALGIAVQLLRGTHASERTGEQLEAAFLDLLLLVAAEDRSSERLPPRWLVQVRDRLHAEHCGPCRVRELADAAGVHPVHLARAFRRHYGRSVTDYLRQIRVGAAAARLAAGESSVARIAADSGFADQSHLSRSFKRLAGAPPAAYRAFARRV